MMNIEVMTEVKHTRTADMIFRALTLQGQISDPGVRTAFNTRWQGVCTGRGSRSYGQIDEWKTRKRGRRGSRKALFLRGTYLCTGFSCCKQRNRTDSRQAERTAFFPYGQIGAWASSIVTMQRNKTVRQDFFCGDDEKKQERQAGAKKHTFLTHLERGFLVLQCCVKRRQVLVQERASSLRHVLARACRQMQSNDTAHQKQTCKFGIETCITHAPEFESFMHKTSKRTLFGQLAQAQGNRSAAKRSRPDSKAELS